MFQSMSSGVRCGRTDWMLCRDDKRLGTLGRKTVAAATAVVLAFCLVPLPASGIAQARPDTSLVAAGGSSVQAAAVDEPQLASPDGLGEAPEGDSGDSGGGVVGFHPSRRGR